MSENPSPTESHTTKYYTAEEAAEMVGMSKWTIYRWVRDGEFPGVLWNGRVVRVPADDLEEWIAKHRRTA